MLRLRQMLKPFSEKGHPTAKLLSVVREKGVIIRDTENDEENHNFIPDDLSGYKFVRKGQFAMNKMKAWQGSYGVSDYEGIVSPAYFVFDLVADVLPRFFHIAIRSCFYVPFFARASDGIRVGQWDLSMPRMKEIPFLIPPPSEQKAIVDYLDAKMAKFDQLIKLKEREIELLQEKKQVVISRAVKSDKKTIPVKYIVSIDNGSDPVTQGTTPVYGSGAESFKSCGEFKIGPAVLLGRKGATLHIPHYVEGKYWNVDTAFDAKPLGDRVDLRFFYYCAICFDYRRFISQTTLPSMTKSDYGRMRIPMLAMPEQRKIAAYLDAETAKTDKVIAVMRRQIELLREYRMRLMSDAVTGRIDLRKEAC